MPVNLKGSIIILSLGTLMIVGFPSSCQDPDSTDLPTPFRKGRWLTGLSGTISSSTVERDTATQKTFSNQYGIAIRSTRFVADRWAVGLNLSLTRLNSDAFIEETSEILQVGPLVRFYTSKNPRGSMFLQGSVVYSKFEERTKISDPNFNFHTVIKGGGVGVDFGIGYSYVLSEKVLFDLAMNYDINFIDATVEDRVLFTSVKERITRGAILFSFGFNILIDEFFF